MSYFGHCPQCGQEISDSRNIYGGICECGWYETSHVTKQEQKMQRTLMKNLILSGLFLVLIFSSLVHLSSQDGQILLLKTQMQVNLANTEDLYLLSHLCSQKKDYKCAESAHLRIYNQKPEDLNNLLLFGQTSVRLNQPERATRILSRYIKQGGTSPDAYYFLGLAYENQENYKQAAVWYEKAILVDPLYVSLTAAHSLVNILIKTQNLRKAKVAIRKIRKATGQKDILRTELNNISKLLKSGRI